MNKSPTNKIGNTTTTATDTRKKTTAIGIRFNKKPTTKPRRRFGLTCSEKRQQAKWNKINEARRTEVGLSKTARKAKNKAAETRIAAHKAEVASARKAHRNAKKGIVEEAVVVEEADEELKPLIAGLFTLLDISSTASNKAINAALGTFAYEQLVEICTKAMPGPMGRTYAGRFNKAGFVATAVFTEDGKTTRKVMLLSKLSDSFVAKHQTRLQTKIIAIEEAADKEAAAKEAAAKKVTVKAPGPVKLTRSPRIEFSERICKDACCVAKPEATTLSSTEYMVESYKPTFPNAFSSSLSPEIDFSSGAALQLGMNENNDYDTQKNNMPSDWEDDESDDWLSRSDSYDAYGRGPTNCSWNSDEDSDQEVEDDGCKSRTTWQTTLKRHAKGGIVTADISSVPSLPASCGWGPNRSQPAPKKLVESKPAPVKQLVESKLELVESKPAPVKQLVESKPKTPTRQGFNWKPSETALDELDDLESSDDEDSLAAFARVKKQPVKKQSVKPVKKKQPKKQPVKKPEPTMDSKLTAALAQPAKKSRRGRDMTAFFFQSQQDAKKAQLVEQGKIQEKRKADAIANNEKRTAAFEAFKHRGAGGKDAGRNKHTKACKHAIDANGNWLVKHKCTHGSKCGFAHNGEELAAGRIALGCLFDPNCRKMDFPATKSRRCWCVHNVKDGENKRPESLEEYFERTGRNMTDPLQRQRIQISMQKRCPVASKPRAQRPTDIVSMKVSEAALESRKKRAEAAKKNEKPKSAWESRSRKAAVREPSSFKQRINRVLRETPATKFARKGGDLTIKTSTGFVVSVGKGKQRATQRGAKIFNGIVRFQAQIRKLNAKAAMVPIRAEHKARQAELEAERRFRAAADAHLTKHRAKAPVKSAKPVVVAKAASWAPKPVAAPANQVSDLKRFCTEFKWMQILPQLIELGAESVRDLKDLDDEDFASLGLKKLAKKRFLRHIAAAGH
jgi:hypothetical protein